MTQDEWDVGRTSHERVFLHTLASRSGDLARHPPFDVWTFYPQLVITLSIADPVHNCVLRTLRVDYDGRSAAAGNDPSHQINSDLDQLDPDYTELTRSDNPELLAESAFNWFRDQGRRPIDRLEWDGPSHQWLLWVLADDERPLCARHLGRPSRPADRVTRLPPPVI